MEVWTRSQAQAQDRSQVQSQAQDRSQAQDQAQDRLRLGLNNPVQGPFYYYYYFLSIK